MNILHFFRFGGGGGGEGGGEVAGRGGGVAIFTCQSEKNCKLTNWQTHTEKPKKRKTTPNYPERLFLQCSMNCDTLKLNGFILCLHGKKHTMPDRYTYSPMRAKATYTV